MKIIVTILASEVDAIIRQHVGNQIGVDVKPEQLKKSGDDYEIEIQPEQLGPQLR